MMAPCGEAGPFEPVALGPPAGHGWGPHDDVTRRHGGFQFFAVGLPPKALSINSALSAPSLVPVRSCCSGQTSRGHTSLCRLIS